MAEHTLKLRAGDAEDMAVLSALLQDALVEPAAFAFDAERGVFAGALVRFLHEERRGSLLGPLRQTTCMLALHRVRSVRLRGIERERGHRPLELLAVTVEEGGGALHLVFAGGGTIRVAVEAIDCRLEDAGQPWITTLRPRHDDRGPP